MRRETLAHPVSISSHSTRCARGMGSTDRSPTTGATGAQGDKGVKGDTGQRELRGQQVRAVQPVRFPLQSQGHLALQKTDLSSLARLLRSQSAQEARKAKVFVKARPADPPGGGGGQAEAGATRMEALRVSSIRRSARMGSRAGTRSIGWNGNRSRALELIEDPSACRGLLLLTRVVPPQRHRFGGRC